MWIYGKSQPNMLINLWECGFSRSLQFVSHLATSLTTSSLIFHLWFCCLSTNFWPQICDFVACVNNLAWVKNGTIHLQHNSKLLHLLFTYNFCCYKMFQHNVATKYSDTSFFVTHMFVPTCNRKFVAYRFKFTNMPMAHLGTTPNIYIYD